MVTVEREPVARDERRGQAAILRRLWRLHFWIGLFAAPVLILLAGTGLEAQAPPGQNDVASVIVQREHEVVVEDAKYFHRIT